MSISAGLPPSPWIRRFAGLIPPSRAVLDLACGSGRHARWLAQRGHPVLAVDRDGEALATLAEVPGVETLPADLEGAPWPLAGRSFAGIVVTNYLHRPLMPFLAASLEAGGVLLYETFMAGNERFGRPSRPDFLLQPGELLDFAREQGLQVLAYEAGEVSRPKPAMVQRLAAWKPGPGAPQAFPIPPALGEGAA
ncbi:MAG TPA: methyltransferase domain-containing protein [Azospira sp.]|nr:methyltransferase domain-containing protein [Azospira sp.]